MERHENEAEKARKKKKKDKKKKKNSENGENSKDGNGKKKRQGGKGKSGRAKGGPDSQYKKIHNMAPAEEPSENVQGFLHQEHDVTCCLEKLYNCGGSTPFGARKMLSLSAIFASRCTM